MRYYTIKILTATDGAEGTHKSTEPRYRVVAPQNK